MPQLDIDAIRPIVLSDTPAGDELFYTLIWDRPMPNHVRDWAEEDHQYGGPGSIVVYDAFRGSTKTTAITNTGTLKNIGLRPRECNLILRASEEKGRESAAWIADAIANNPAWKAIFPNIVPDTEAGWSSAGYKVKDVSMPYGEWRRGLPQNPCWAGFGYTSKDYHGNHPDGWLVLDDIDTETNTRSDRERAEVRDIIKGTIMPMRVPMKTRTKVVGTPWLVTDTLSYFSSLEGVHTCFMPIIRNGVPTWPEIFPQTEIDKIRSNLGSIEFARQYLLDVKAVEGQTLKRDWLHRYPVEKIDPSWPCVFGVDYASTQDKLKDRDHDYYAISIMRKIPGGGLVLVDGFRSNSMSQGEAEQKLMSLAMQYRPQVIGVEDLGKGEEFYASLIRHTQLPVVPSRKENKSKGYKFEKAMAPHFEYSRCWVSTEDTPYIRIFMDEWVSWDHGDNDDTLDATFHAVNVSPDALPNIMDAFGDYKPKVKRTNPWASWATGG